MLVIFNILLILILLNVFCDIDVFDMFIIDVRFEIEVLNVGGG